MKDAFTNRSGMFQTVLTTLNDDRYKPVWFNQPPVIFTTKAGQAADAVADLAKFCRAQGTGTTGAAQEKDREQREAVDATFPLARALVQWFGDQQDESNAGKVDLTQSDFRKLRDQQLLETLRLVRDLAKGVTTGALAADAVAYGVTAAAVQASDKEVEEYAAVIAAPQAGIADRKALTGQMRDRFNAVEDKFAVLDDMILQFNTTPAGRALIAAYQTSRVVRDLGAGPSPKQPPTPPPAK